MKSEHRHDLKTNDLGKWVAELGESTGKYTNQILAGALGLLLLAAVALYWSRSSAASASAGWNEMAAARSAEEFANVADEFKGTVAGSWARLKEGEIHLDNGMRLSFTDRASGLSDLNKARKSLEEIVGDALSPADVKERALFNLGRCLETLSDRNTDDAIAIYQRLVADYPYTAYKTAANNRIEALRTGGAQEFYAWFHEQHPKPADRELPRDMALPGGLDLKPGQPATNGDGKAGDGKTSDEKTAPDEKAGDAKSEKSSGAEGAPKSDAGKGAAKSEEKPAADSKPEPSSPPAKPE